MSVLEASEEDRQIILKRLSDHDDRFELLVFSEAGKPIYSYSRRDDAVTLMPLCSALIDYAKKTQNEMLKSMKTSDNLMINFTTRKPLIIIVIHDCNSYIDPVIVVDQVEAQIISILTAKTLKSVFEERMTFDLKRLLYGSEKLIDAITTLSTSVNIMEWPWVQAFLAVTPPSKSIPNNSQTNASIQIPKQPYRALVPIVIMPSNVRDVMHNHLQNVISTNSKNVVFSLLFKIIQYNSDENDVTNNTQNYSNNAGDDLDMNTDVGFKLITVCNHHSRHKLKIVDMHIVLALLYGSRSQLLSVESVWMPVCLPRFNQDAYLHSLLSYTNENKNCLVMFSVDRDDFMACQKSRNEIEEKLNSIYKDVNMKEKLEHQVCPLVHPVLLELQEKLVSNVLSEDEFAEAQKQIQIYNSKLELYHARQLQFVWYQTNKQVLWWQRSSKTRPSRVLFYLTKKMIQSSLKSVWLRLEDQSVFLGWHVPAFQLYAQFDKTVDINEATEVIQRITNWVKKEEENFSVRNYR